MVITTARLVTQAPGIVLVSLTADTNGAGEPLSVTLHYHDDVTTDWFANGSAMFDGTAWHMEVRTDLIVPPVLQIAEVRDAQQVIQIECSNTFANPGGAGEWASGDEAATAVTELREARQKRYIKPIIAEGCSGDDPEHCIVVLADNLHLTRPQHVPGISVFPLQAPLFGREMLGILYETLARAGFTEAPELQGLEADLRHHRPSVVVHVPTIHANKSEIAFSQARRQVQSLLDLMALRRHAQPHVLASVVGKRRPDRSVEFVGISIEGSYRGNLLGGFVSGESQPDLLAQWAALDNDPRLRLWLALYADAIADARWDYRLFRCFNLLEGIGKELLPPNQAVCDSNGTPLLQANGRAYTTRQARGKVFEIARKAAVATNTSEESFSTPRSDGTREAFWDEVALWVAVRNAVAHTGSWELPEGATPNAEHLAVEQALIRRGFDGELLSGAEATTRSIREAVDNTLHAIIRRLI